MGREGFDQFDFEANTQWRQYRANLEIPTGTDMDAALLKLRAKWYKRHVDPDFDLSAVNGTSQSATSQPRESSEPSTASRPQQSQPSSTAGGGTKSAREPSRQSPAFLQTLKKIFAPSPELERAAHDCPENADTAHKARLFFLHLAIIISAVIHLQPFLSTPSAYSRFLKIAAITHGYKVSQRYGLPRVWPFKLDAVTAWLKSASASTDFQYVMLALVFIPGRPLLLVMVPFTTLAVYHVAAYACQHYGHTAAWRRWCSGPYQWLAARQQQAVVINAAAEIGTGFLTILNLLTPPRNPFLVFIHWQWLRMRYWSPDSANNHRLVWGQLDSKFGRYLDFLPALRYPVGYVQRWFQSAQTVQQR